MHRATSVSLGIMRDVGVDLRFKWTFAGKRGSRHRQRFMACARVEMGMLWASTVSKRSNMTSAASDGHFIIFRWPAGFRMRMLARKRTPSRHLSPTF